jgi:hypothetical protein
MTSARKVVKRNVSRDKDRRDVTPQAERAGPWMGKGVRMEARQGRNLPTAGCGSRQPLPEGARPGAINSRLYLTSSTLPPHSTNFSR